MTLVITTLHFWPLSLASMPFPRMFFRTPRRCIRKPPNPPAVLVAQVVDPAVAEVVAVEDAAVVVADAEAEQCKIGLEWVGARS